MSELKKLPSYSCPVELTYQDSEKYRVLRENMPHDFNDPMRVYGKLMILAGKYLSPIRQEAIQEFAFECYTIIKRESDFKEAYSKIKLRFLQSNDRYPMSKLEHESEWILKAGGEYYRYGLKVKVLKESPKNDSLRQQYKVMKKFFDNCAWKAVEDFIDKLWNLKEFNEI